MDHDANLSSYFLNADYWKGLVPYSEAISEELLAPFRYILVGYVQCNPYLLVYTKISQIIL
ncbi:hypothetical protein KDI_05000 [Dictyobacter arantiisoli]|uniref:Uncharacterized protein n=1 Tax=Dictyobacter arantiisoli TaxID=2014874 RepID=A0A5A5T6X8_9CHLR|nr:hypothetical protein KDI_05000 [Dictyobacter arantiisoli]